MSARARSRQAQRRLATALSVAVLLVPVPVGPAHAQARRDPPDGAPPKARLLLASQTPWVGDGQELVLRLLAQAQRRDDVELAVTIYPRITSRSEFRRTNLDHVRGSPLTVAVAPLTELPSDAGGAVTIRFPIQGRDQPRDAERLILTREGVYPVQAEIRETGGGKVRARLTSHMVYVPGRLEGARLGFSWIMPFHAAPAVSPDGRHQLGAPAAARLSLLARALEAHAEIPLVVRPTPETVEALAVSERAGDREALSALGKALRGRQVLAAGYVAVSARAALRAGLDEELDAQQDRGADVLNQALRLRADPRTLVVDDPIDAEVLARAREQQVDRLVAIEAALEPVELPVTLAQPFVVEARPTVRRATRAVVADAGLAAHFSQAADQVLAGHRLLADLAVVHFDNPGRRRGVVVLAPRKWAAARPFLEVVLAGLASSPIVEPMTLDGVFAEIPVATTSAGRPLVRRLARERGRARNPLPARAIVRARNRVESFSEMVDPGNPIYESLDRQLLASQSVDLSEKRRGGMIEGVQTRLDAELSRVQMPPNSAVRLTARRGEIPITIQSATGYPIHAVVRVDSDKLQFPEGDTRKLELTRQNTTERFAVVARSSGAFPLRVSLASADGRLVLGRSLFTVRSTATSGVGVILSAAAGSFLIVWWGRHLLRTRRRRRAAPT